MEENQNRALRSTKLEQKMLSTKDTGSVKEQECQTKEQAQKKLQWTLKARPPSRVKELGKGPFTQKMHDSGNEHTPK